MRVFHTNTNSKVFREVMNDSKFPQLSKILRNIIADVNKGRIEMVQISILFGFLLLRISK